MGYLLDVCRQKANKIEETYKPSNPIEKAMIKDIKEWTKLRDHASKDMDWFYYNALKRLREAIDKKKKLDIEIWKHIVCSLQVKVKQ